MTIISKNEMFISARRAFRFAVSRGARCREFERDFEIFISGEGWQKIAPMCGRVLMVEHPYGVISLDQVGEANGAGGYKTRVLV